MLNFTVRRCSRCRSLARPYKNRPATRVFAMGRSGRMARKRGGASRCATDLSSRTVSRTSDRRFIPTEAVEDKSNAARLKLLQARPSSREVLTSFRILIHLVVARKDSAFRQYTLGTKWSSGYRFKASGLKPPSPPGVAALGAMNLRRRGALVEESYMASAVSAGIHHRHHLVATCRQIGALGRAKSAFRLCVLQFQPVALGE
ncbi:hypothetical protein SAMN05216337_105047 [Bradyrhizobium brasilense]|uniref:Uncharacterized protein n=1 Tax=Bradyrhizobium brasilense TaxID=1419277 RepID=A0A1G7JXT2_9BRAD|nr:hypothetical protein SAMN05216337_105047 [Bradyrhizobium brasilense]